MKRLKNRFVSCAGLSSLTLLVALAGCGGEGSTAHAPPVASTGRALETVPGGYDLSYDSAGRLVEVSAATGQTAQYIYDPAGNLVGIRRIASGTVSVMGFSPVQGSVGQVVTVFGAGFNPTASQNTVRLNGTAVTVLSATSAQLTFAVPAGATTGKIAVTTGDSTATSTDDFTVIAGDLIAITDFTPKIGPRGTAVTISGTGFLPDPLMDSVFIGGEAVALGSASPTSLQVTAGAFSGKVSVSIPFATATSIDDFVVLPGTYSIADIASTGRTSIGTPSTVTISTAGKAALLLFDGTQGQHLSLYVSSVTFAGETVISIYQPGGNVFSRAYVFNGESDKFDLGQLPLSGTYTIAIQPSSATTGNVSLQILQDAAGTLVTGGPPTPMALVAGQNGRYTMAGNAGDYLGLSVTSLTTDPSGGYVGLYLYSPDGSYLWGTGFSGAPASSQLPQLPTSGTYTLQILPWGTSAASLAVKLVQSTLGSVAADGSATQFQTTGQAGRFSFTGTAGQGWTLQATAGSTFASSIGLWVYRPNGDYLTGWTLYAGSDVKLDLGILPETGTYTVELAPSSGVDAGTVSLRLVSEATGTLTTGAALATITLGTAQNGRYTMAGNAGDYLGLAVTSLTTDPSGGYVSLYLYSPDGSYLWGTGLSGAPASWQLCPSGQRA